LCWQPLSTRIPCATPDLLLKHPDATVATYKRKHPRHMKHVFATLAKKSKHLQQTYETLEIYVYNMHVYATFR
jgi:hypothetical protein